MKVSNDQKKRPGAFLFYSNAEQLGKKIVEVGDQIVIMEIENCTLNPAVYVGGFMYRTIFPDGTYSEHKQIKPNTIILPFGFITDLENEIYKEYANSPFRYCFVDDLAVYEGLDVYEKYDKLKDEGVVKNEK